MLHACRRHFVLGVLLVTLASFLPSVAAETDQLMKHWQAADNLAAPTCKPSAHPGFVLFFPHNDQREGAQAVPGDSLHDRLAASRAAHGPSNKAANLVKAWIIDRLGHDRGAEFIKHSCAIRWDRLDCGEARGVTITHDVISALFGSSHESLACLQPKDPRHKTFAGRAMLKREHPAVIAGLEAGFAAHGVYLYNPSRKPRRHGVVKQDEEASEESFFQPQSEQRSVFNDTDPDHKAWPRINTTNAPVLLGVGNRYDNVSLFSVAVQCRKTGAAGADGIVATAAAGVQASTAAGPGGLTCPPGYQLPYFARLILRSPGSNTFGTITSDWLPLNASTCGGATSNASFFNLRAPFMANPNSSVANDAVCVLSVKDDMRFQKLPLYRRFTASAEVRFGTSASTAIAQGTTSTAGEYLNYAFSRFFTDPNRYGADKGTVQFFPYTGATPQDIQQLYGILPPVTEELEATSVGRHAQGVVEFTDVTAPFGGFNVSDVDIFAKNLQLSGVSLADLKVINGAGNVAKAETALDVELMMGINPGVRTYLYNVIYGGTTGCPTYDCAFLRFLGNVLDPVQGETADLPSSVWSISWGGPEDGMDIARFESYFKILSIAGVSVVASTGDRGAAWDDEWMLVAEFPSTSAYVVAAGATSLENDESTGNTAIEIACSAADSNIITTGGGYSTNVAAAAHQNTTAGAYTASQRGMKEALGVSDRLIDKQFPVGRRAVPDIAALGANIYTVIDGKASMLYGTSASAPIMGAIISQLNARRLSANTTTLPLMNEMLYFAAGNNSRAFRDVTRGSNCGGEYDGPTLAMLVSANDTQCYNATVGWDAVSGLGAVVFPELALVAMKWNPALPAAVPSGPEKRSALTRAMFGLCMAAMSTTLLVILFCVVRARGITGKRTIAQASEDIDAPLARNEMRSSGATRQSDVYAD